MYYIVVGLIIFNVLWILLWILGHLARYGKWPFN